MMKRREFMLLSGAVAAGLAMPSIARAQGRPKVLISQASEGFLYLPLYLARAGGMFETAGIDVETMPIKGGGGTMAGLVGGDVQAAYTSALQVPVARTNGVPVTAFAATVTRFQADLVVSKALLDKAGVGENDPIEARLKALKGSTIGVINHTGGPAHILRFLAEYAGLDPRNDMVLSPVGDSAATIAAYGQGRIDGVIYSPPTSTIALQKHGGVLLASMSRGDYPPMADFLYGALIGTQAWLDSNPEAAQALVTAIARAEKALHEDPKSASAAMRPYLKGIDDATFDAAFDLNLPSFPKDPRMTDAQFVKIYDFLSRTEGKPITAARSDCFTDRFADVAAAAL